MTAGKIHKPRIKFRSSLSTCRHAGIVGPHHLDAGEIHCLKGIEVRIPAVLFKQIVLENFRLNHQCSGVVSRITRVRNQHLVPLVQEGKHNKQNALLGAGEGLNLASGIKSNAIET